MQLRWRFFVCPSLAIALLASGSSLAHADTVTAIPNDVHSAWFAVDGSTQAVHLYSLNTQESLGVDYLGALDTIKGTVSVASSVLYGTTPQLVQSKDQGGFFTQIDLSSGGSAVIDTSQAMVTGFSMFGGLTLTAPVTNSVSAGGSIRITDLHVDGTTGLVNGTVVGGNGVGTQSNVALWRIGHLSATSVFAGTNSCPTLFCDYFGAEGYSLYDVSLTASDLHLTEEGKNLFKQSLGLLSLGQSALLQVDPNMGTLTMTARFETPGIAISAVPEPAVWSMMGLGLLGLCAASRRQPG